MTTDNHSQFSKLLDKHLYFLPAGFGEGYDNKFTKHAQIYVIINMFLVDFFNRGIHFDNETLSELKKYHTILISGKNQFTSLTEELEAIDFLLSLEPLSDLRRS